MLTLAGRTAVVTGGSRGIGYAIATALGKAGMPVAILSRDMHHIKNAVDKLSASGCRCSGFPCDVSKPEEIREALEQVYQYFGRIDAVVNSAGVLDTQSLGETSEAVWDQVIDTNLKGAFFMIQYAIPYLKQSKAARIVNISSNAGRMGGYENGLAYTASKGGLISLTYGVARRLGEYGITVNCVAPGTIESDMSSKYSQETRERLLPRFPLHRFGTPEEVAAAVCYFVSEEAAFTTGAVLDVNGGLFMG